MKKLFLFSLFLLSQNNSAYHVPVSTFDMGFFDKMNYSAKADIWFNSHARHKSRDDYLFLGKYCACRIQEITSWLTLQRHDLNKFQQKLARIQYWDALERKKKMEAEVRGAYFGANFALHELRNEAKRIAEYKFTDEVIKNFGHYKSGKTAAAKAAKLSFYTYCWSLLIRDDFKYQFGY